MKALTALLPYYRPYRGQVALGLLFVACMAFLSLAGPVVVGRAVDHLLEDMSRSKLLGYGGLLVGIALVQGLFSFGQRMVLVRVSRSLEHDIRERYVSHLLLLTQAFFQDHRTGDLMARATSDLEAVRRMSGPAIMYWANAIFATLGALAIMGRLHGPLTLLALCTLPLVAIAARIFGSRIHGHSTAVQEQFAELSTKVQENFSGARVVRAYVQEEAEQEDFRRLNQEYLARNRRLIAWSAVFSPLLQLLIGLGFVGVLAYGGVLTYRGVLSVGELVEFQLLLARLSWPMIAIGFVLNMVQRGRASMERILAVLESPVGIRDEDPQPLPAVRGNLTLRDLSFAYPDTEEPVLRNLDLEISIGTVVALVGRTGAGKSTFLSLIPRLLDPPPGHLAVDGRDVRRLPLDQLRASIGFVPQESFLFSATVGENIAFGRPEASREEILEAAHQAGLAEDLGFLPQGLDTVVGERGITLSGGQKQRVALARALIRRPRILLLDDCLSAVDTHTEETILGNLRRVFTGRTVIMVSHRVSTVEGADLILVLDHGRIAERGTHDELLARGGLYADLERRQRLEEELAAV